MPNVGPFELLVLAVIVVALLGVVFAAARAGARPAGPLAWRSPGMVPPVSAALQQRVRELYAENKKVEAIKLIREETGLGLKEAKDLADGIGAGRPLPVATARHGYDLAARAREMKAAGRVEQAVFLVRGETGMSQSEAERFVDSLVVE
ncbi:ribosomal protein L7/L12 [Microbispora triticiradicis]|uniref:ribosomal protein L7/L12 n=1 Tax=Microbispora triticiradicis TaxID=2200763 RepID=UPI001AD6F310|nr:ribosomal protein L7/L12 [Microbispora triticiradicis]MBO4274398.1 50S ribosomal protein L7/L12 [Microbispora triticiradicis]